MAYDVSQALAKGVQQIFKDTYAPEAESVSALIGDGLMKLSVGSDGLFENYAYHTSPLHPEYRDRGAPPRDGLIESVGWQVRNLNWEREILWHEDDEQDDRLNHIRARAAEASINWAWLDARVAFQMLSGTADPLLLPSIPLAPDGAALFSATDGSGADRFGVTGGNLVGGQTLNTEQGFEEAFLATKQRLLQFRDTHGIAPLNLDSSLKSGLVLYYSRDNEEVVSAALARKFRATFTGVAGEGASQSNYFIDGDMKVEARGTVFLSGSDFYLGLKKPRHQPLFRQDRMKLRMLPITPENSPERHGEVGFWLKSRSGFGMNLPTSIVKATS